jgi:glycosyltransferase involved in cell wall biosynthesis
MPVHNAELFLDESIKSIVAQSFAEFEFIILDDCSTDRSPELVAGWAQRDPRIRVFRSERQLGLSGSSNVVVSKAGTPFVARMDADDVAHPDRLKRQMEVIQRHDDVVAVGTLCDGIDAEGRRTRPRDRWRILRRSNYIPFPHGSAMFRRSAFEAIGGYRDNFIAGEDQDFFFRMRSVGRVVTLSDVLYHFRYHTTNATVLNGARAVEAIHSDHNQNGHDLASHYMLGSMRLWAGQAPQILPQMIATKSLGWNVRSVLALSTASIGSMSPATLRFLLRSFIRARDGVASLGVRDGRPYEWRLK